MSMTTNEAIALLKRAMGMLSTMDVLVALEESLEADLNAAQAIDDANDVRAIERVLEHVREAQNDAHDGVLTQLRSAS